MPEKEAIASPFRLKKRGDYLLVLTEGEKGGKGSPLAGKRSDPCRAEEKKEGIPYRRKDGCPLHIAKYSALPFMGKERGKGKKSL